MGSVGGGGKGLMSASWGFHLKQCHTTLAHLRTKHIKPIFAQQRSLDFPFLEMVLLLL